MAMLLAEALGRSFRERVKIYATDIDDEALQKARQAVYSRTWTSDVPEALRDRYFELVNGRYVFTPRSAPQRDLRPQRSHQGRADFADRPAGHAATR